MKEKKITWWKILLIIFFLPFAIIYYAGKYLIKFYKSSKYTERYEVHLCQSLRVCSNAQIYQQR